jgi:hypothetical protein
MPTFVDRGSHVVSVTDPYGFILVFLTGATEWTSFQTHYFSENLILPGIKLGPLDM